MSTLLCVNSPPCRLGATCGFSSSSTIHTAVSKKDTCFWPALLPSFCRRMSSKSCTISWSPDAAANSMASRRPRSPARSWETMRPVSVSYTTLKPLAVMEPMDWTMPATALSMLRLAYSVAARRACTVHVAFREWWSSWSSSAFHT